MDEDLSIQLPFVRFLYWERNIRTGEYSEVEYSGYIKHRYSSGAFTLVDRPTKTKVTRNPEGRIETVDHVYGDYIGYFEPVAITAWL